MLFRSRVFAAAGIKAGPDVGPNLAKDDKEVINRRVQQWRFDLPTARDEQELRAVRLATIYLREHANTFPHGFVPDNPTQLALLAIRVFEAFLEHAEHSVGNAAFDPRINTAVVATREQVAAREQFDRSPPA